MAGVESATATIANTVLGPVRAEDLGVVSVHEALLCVVPGAQYGYDVTIDRSAIFAVLAAKLEAFQRAGGGTIVDGTGMFSGRDVNLLEALSRATGVHIIASTGMGPEEMLGGYFLTPQTNPPVPWPAERFAELFGAEIAEGMVVPRVERRGAAGLIAATATRTGMTPTDESLFRGAARAALSTGVAVSIRFGADAVAELDIVLDEGLDAARVVVGGLDRTDAVAAGAVGAIAGAGAYVGIDHIGSADDCHIDDQERVELISELISAGHAERILLSAGAVGYAVPHAAPERPFGSVLTGFVPRLVERGISDGDVRRLLVDNPRQLLGIRANGPRA